MLPALALAAGALIVFLTGSNQSLFLMLNARAQGLPPAWWSALSVSGSVLGALALLAPTLKTQPRWLGSALLAAPLGVLVSEGGKRAFDLMRPAGVLDNDSFQLIGVKLYVLAFPSGHAITAFVLAACLTLAWPGHRRWLAGLGALGMAGLIAFSRIAVGAHWPVDVLTGAACGWLIGALGVALSARLRFWDSPRGLRVMGAVCLASSLALLVTDQGYPLARLFQISLAAWGIGGAAAALMADRNSPP